MRKLSTTLALLSFAICSTAFAEKPRVYTANPLETAAEYNQRARDAYAAGVWTIEEVETDSSEINVDPEQRQRAYARALLAFAEAVNAEPTMYEAHTYIGYANRKLGNYQEALRAYDTALELKPNYAFAIEYQGEAYLEIGEFSRAKFNYLRLYALDMTLAAKLRAAIDAWTRTAEAKKSQELAAALKWVDDSARP